MRCAILVLSALILHATSVFTQEAESQNRALRLDDRLLDRMQEYRLPGMSVAVVNENQIQWARGFGVLKAGGTTEVKTDTLFQAASLSKPVTAMATLALVGKGKLELDDDIDKVLTDWPLPYQTVGGK